MYAHPFHMSSNSNVADCNKMDFREAESETMDLDKGAQDRDSGRLL
jgi:hypothetical protein